MSRKRTEGVRHDRRRLIRAAGGTLVLALTPHHIARGATLLGVRVWPARDYTRVALEHDEPLKFNHFVIRDTLPLRMVVDVEGIDLTPGFRELVSKVEPNDPYIGLIRVGQNRPKVVRLVIELKEDVKPQVFSLEPVGPYQHRLVMDLYPVSPPDPLMALLREQATPRDSDFGTAQRQPEADRTAARASATPPTRRNDGDVQRIVTVAIDPGHGGEDPGAVGKAGTFEKAVTLSIARRLRELIVADSTMRVALTRDGDYFVPLRTRVAKACALTCWCRSTPTPGSGRTRAAPRCSHCRRTARRAAQPHGWRGARTRRTSSAASTSRRMTSNSRACCWICRRPRRSTTV
jgi:N-acetylmuramoyl-L-alanine amidase